MGWRSKRDGAELTSGEIENVLGRSLHIHGDLKADGAFRIDGTVDGAVESKAGVVIGETGHVNGPVQGKDVVVAGHVCGNITASGHLEILASGKIDGDIAVQSLRIATGGVFRGTSRMGGTPADDAAHGHLASVK